MCVFFKILLLTEFTSSQVKRPLVPDDSGVIIELNETAAECEKMLDNDNSNTIISKNHNKPSLLMFQERIVLYTFHLFWHIVNLKCLHDFRHCPR